MIFLGTIVNALAVCVGSLIGVSSSKLLTKSKRFEQIPNVIMKAVGICVIYIGISGMLSNNTKVESTLGSYALLVMIGCIAIGTLIGELLNIDGALERLGKAIESKITKKKYDENGNEIAQEKTIAKGFVSATLLFCVGAMAITGAIESGLSGGEMQSTLFAKSTLDFISSIVFGATLGIGTIFSAVAVLVYQGLIELIAIFVGNFLPSAVVAEMSATGSALIFALGLNMVGATKIKVANMLPAIFLPLIMCIFIR
ncbi:MAG: DUF554 domain-containing protein [Clostridia bacterium]|nr:DUF554 domain-containing protein [Clostridia bacterium]